MQIKTAIYHLHQQQAKLQKNLHRTQVIQMTQYNIKGISILKVIDKTNKRKQQQRCLCVVACVSQGQHKDPVWQSCFQIHCELRYCNRDYHCHLCPLTQFKRLSHLLFLASYQRSRYNYGLYAFPVDVNDKDRKLYIIIVLNAKPPPPKPSSPIIQS